jgi:hypothetical protein
VNTLDDYEEGTWTPSVGGTATYGAANGGIYTKIGRVVNVSGIIDITLLGTGSGTTISNLPFTVAAGTYPANGSIGYFNAIAQSVVSFGPSANPNATTLNFRSLTAAASSQGNGNVLGNAARIDFTLTYITAT